MKIALFADTYLPDINGVVSSVVLLKKKLEDDGHEVWVITNHPGIAKIIIEDHVIRLPGIEIKPLYGYKMTQPLHLLFIEELKNIGFDIIHAQQEFGVGIYASIVAKVLNIPLVRTYHTAYEDYTTYFLPIKNDLIDSAAKKTIEQLSKIVGEDCLRLVAPSRKTKEMLVRYGIKTPIEVIPTGLELDRFKPVNQNKNDLKKLREEIGIKENELMFIYVGRIGAEKSIDMIIDGFKTVALKKLNAKLVIVGGGPDLEGLKKHAIEIGIGDYVMFLGKKPNTEVPLYYNAADVFVSASITETQGMTYVEAMASGLPLICRKDEVLEDVLIENENGYFFNDADSFAMMAEKFINLSCEERIDMSNSSLKIADMYDADLFGKNMALMYQEVIEEFRSALMIEKIQVKEDIVNVYLKSDEAKEKITVSIDTYMEIGLRKGMRITRLIYDRIKTEQEETLAYRNALRKLSSRDYSEKEMHDYLYANYELSIVRIEDIISKMKKYDFIDDEKFAFNKVNSFSNALYSRRMMSKKLKEAGISQEIVDKYVRSTADEELIKAKKLSEKYNLLIRGKSLKARKQAIIKKLVDNGYSIDVAKNACEFLDFSAYTLDESELLKKEALKAKIKYSRKYKGSELRNHVFHSLLQKGFEYETIYAVIDEMGWDND